MADVDYYELLEIQRTASADVAPEEIGTRSRTDEGLC